MPEPLSKVEEDRRAIAAAKSQGPLATVATYTRLSGPGWLQSALTLGGGSLGSSLYLGVLAGFSLLWLQPLAMILGIIMLSAIGYVTISTTERPFPAINRHINPVLGWGWALASLTANMVWCLPQYALASGVLQQNLLPGVLGENSPLGDFWAKVVISASILLLTLLVTWAYDSGGWGIRLYELILKLVVAGIVACFVGVVVVVTIKGDLQWGAVFSGLVPDFTQFWKPAETFEFLLQGTADYRDFWSDLIVAKQRDVMFSAAATAVGINMTFLLPYSMIRRGWDKDFRGLAVFDLSTGMFIPFVLATSCVVIASASQFHPLHFTATDVLKVNTDPSFELPEITEKRAKELMTDRLRFELGGEAFAELTPEQVTAQLEPLSRMEIVLASHLEEKNAIALSGSLSDLTGRQLAHWIFGIGVLGMTLSSITLLMLISGFVICEMLGLPPKGWPNRLGCLAATTGVLGPFLWAEHARFWLVVPTSVFCFTLLPFAYLTFFFVMNSQGLLGDQMPRGARRLAWNLAIGAAAAIATLASVYMVWVKSRSWSLQYLGTEHGGLGIVAALALLVIVVHFACPRNAAASDHP